MLEIVKEDIMGGGGGWLLFLGFGFSLVCLWSLVIVSCVVGFSSFCNVGCVFSICGLGIGRIFLCFISSGLICGLSLGFGEVLSSV